MSDELDCIFGLGIPKFETVCPVPADPSIDLAAMKQLSQEYQQTKVLALSQSFNKNFPGYFKNLAKLKLEDQQFLDTNVAQYID